MPAVLTVPAGTTVTWPNTGTGTMFHDVTNASKVALVAGVEHLAAAGVVLFDVQWTTPHLVSLGAIDIPRNEYLELLQSAVPEPTDPRPLGL